MLLRRITQHVKDQNWFAVFIDFLIVVVGILIAFQITNWNEARLQKQTAQTYVERIRDDLAANQEDLKQRLDYFGEVRSAAVRALGALDDSPDTLGGKFLIDLYTASHYLPREFGRDTYDEIISVGANNAVSDVETRKRLANFYRSIQAQLTSLKVTTPYREIVRYNLPYSVHKAISTACGDVITTGLSGEPIITLQTDCEPGLSPEEISEAVTEIAKLNIHKDLVRRLIDLDTKLNLMQLIIHRSEMLDEYLKELD